MRFRFGHRFKKRKSLPIIKFEQLFPSFESANILLQYASERYGGVRLNELVYLAFLASLVPSIKIFEIGTGEGRTTLNFILNMDLQGHVYTLDLPHDYKTKLVEGIYTPKQFKSEVKQFEKGILIGDENNRYTLLEGVSNSFDFSPWYGAIDMVFVDGGHTYETVRSDTEHAFKLLKPAGGIILWHDYLYHSCPEVFDFLNELSNKYTLHLIYGTKTVIYLTNLPHII